MIKFASSFLGFMNEDFNENEFSIFDLLDRFEQMLKDNTSMYFESEDFEEIINFYLDTGNLKLAKRAIEEAIHQYPSDYIFSLKQAQYLAANNHEQAALEILSHIEKLEPHDAEIYFTRGTIFSKREKHLEAINEFNRALEYSEDPIDIYLTIAYEYQKLTDYDSAIKVLLKALKMEPNDEDLINELAFCYEITDRLEEGAETLQRFVDEHPYSAQGWFNLGLIFNKLGLYEKSVEAFDFALAIDPSNTSAYFNKANAFANAEMYEQAIVVYKEVLEMDEPDALTYSYIGECYMKLDNTDKAIEYYTQALKLDDQLAEAWHGLAISYETIGKHKTALININKALKIDPYNPSFYHLRGLIYLSLQEFSKSFADLKKAVDRIDIPKELWVELSRVAIVGDLQDEVAAFLLSLEGTEKWEDFIHLAMANIYLSAGRQKEGLMRLQKGVKALEGNAKSLFDFFPEMKFFNEVIEFIALYPNNNNPLLPDGGNPSK
ncbi:MAG: tetratricopeptide repeat protein [Bacteroidales bacterium]